MLNAVLREMESDNAFPEAAPKPLAKLDRGPIPGPVKHALATEGERVAANGEELAALLAERDARIDALETKLAEQEQSVRQVLGMMIEWIESQGRRAA